MRIVAGKYRSLRLQMVDSELTKETADKVRGAVFNSLGAVCNQAVVLDLFAGSGSYGLEALSRGAKISYFVDNQFKAIKTIKANLEWLKASLDADVYQGDYLDAIAKYKSEEVKFDLVFLDPPYAFSKYEDLIDLISKITSDESVIVCETHKQTKLNLEAIEQFELYKESIYGIKKIHYFRKR